MHPSLLGIDFGTSNTVAVLHRNGQGTPLLFEGSPLLPSAVFVDTDEGLLVGRDAERAAAAAPAHLEPNPKRRIDEHTVWLGEQEIAVPDLFAAVLKRVAVEARRVLGHAPDRVVLTHPAGWGNQRLTLLTDAAARAGLGTPRLMAEPAAAAWYFITTLGHAVAPGRCVVVYDFGAGTFDVAVLRRSAEGFDVLAADGLADLGGLDLDAAVVNHLRALTPQAAESWGVLDWPRTATDRRSRKHLWDEVRAAKEQLSRHPSATVHVPLVEADLHVTRAEFEQFARPLLDRTVAVTVATLRAARVGRDAVAGVFLVGGSSRIPLAAVLLHRELGIAPTVMEQPELVVAAGAGSPLAPEAPAAFVPAPEAPVSAGSVAPVSAGPLAPVSAGPLAAGPAAPVSAVGVAAVPVSAVVTPSGGMPVSGPPVSEPVSGPLASGSRPVPPVSGSPVARRRSGLLVAAGVIAVTGSALANLFPILEQMLLASRESTVGWGVTREASPDVLIGETVVLLIAFAVSAVAAALSFRSDDRRWAGAGLLLGVGLFVAGPALTHLRHPNTSPDLVFDERLVFGLGYAMMSVAGALALVAVLRGRPRVTVGRPVRLVPSLALIGLAVAATALYLGVRFWSGQPGTTLAIGYLCAAGATVAMPVWGVLARPVYLGIGMVTAVLMNVLPTILDLTAYWWPMRNHEKVGWSVYGGIGVAMAVAAVGAFRGTTARQDRSR